MDFIEQLFGLSPDNGDGSTEVLWFVVLATLLVAAFWVRQRRIVTSTASGTAARRAKPLILESTLTCPRCGHSGTETMPTNACQYFYDCRGCGALLKPKAGCCCVFCSYGTVKCPPVQQGSCCNSQNSTG